MPDTKIFRAQHEMLEVIAAELTQLIDSYEGKADAYEISLAMTRMMGLLRLHLAQEDRSLYPRLMQSEVRETARTAQRFSEEMGGLAATAIAHASRYSSSEKIAADFDRFRERTHDMLDALAQRIHRENDILYPMADAEAERRLAS